MITTHIVVEGLRFAGVVTCLSPLRCSTIQVPENTVTQRGVGGRGEVEAL